ncbi:MAG: hypothetical protein A2919_02235 [Candidatus Spechtbacteria bacterium RIFCSPLOWO2_01_FULL_43_12]|uniref:DUF5658 domain-containing protein n=1 Tax=Candidatus Spechtbacteria bacterium RIFCSPLOWO2_01_FULL_43_12 TaxID=1802162 RepID=A0A1G2HED8_9BACT|nr:MAG: hypothetical protein A2919_02235 [Candidatus Spechtbacteria bacterium RIFCSPLOWO2_01_FULL_43_12]
MRRLLALNTFLHLADYVTTYFAVTKMGAKEMNPLVRPIIENGQWGRVFMLKVVAIASAGLASRTSKGRTYLLFSNYLMGTVVASNSAQIAVKLILDRRARDEKCDCA